MKRGDVWASCWWLGYVCVSLSLSPFSTSLKGYFLCSKNLALLEYLIMALMVPIFWHLGCVGETLLHPSVLPSHAALPWAVHEDHCAAGHCIHLPDTLPEALHEGSHLIVSLSQEHTPIEPQGRKEWLCFTGFKLKVLGGERCVFMRKNKVERPQGLGNSMLSFHHSWPPFLGQSVFIYPPSWSGVWNGDSSLVIPPHSFIHSLIKHFPKVSYTLAIVLKIRDREKILKHCGEWKMHEGRR